jgi:hypothetical protein
MMDDSETRLNGKSLQGKARLVALHRKHAARFYANQHLPGLRRVEPFKHFDNTNGSPQSRHRRRVFALTHAL